ITLQKSSLPPCSNDPNNPNYQSGGCPPVISCTNIQLFQPVTRNVVEFSIDRVGAVPQVPSPVVAQYLSDGETPNPYYKNYTLLSSNVSPMNTELMPDGYTLVYRVTGVYTYSALNPLDDTGTVPFPIPPWVNVQ